MSALPTSQTQAHPQSMDGPGHAQPIALGSPQVLQRTRLRCPKLELGEFTLESTMKVEFRFADA